MNDVIPPGSHHSIRRDRYRNGAGKHRKEATQASADMGADMGADIDMTGRDVRSV